MPSSDSQTFLREPPPVASVCDLRTISFADTAPSRAPWPGGTTDGHRPPLPTAADRLRSNLDAAVYKHAVPRSGGLRTASSPRVEPALGRAPQSSFPNSSSAFLGDLCAFAVQNSSLSANFAWVQHMLHHLAPNGSMALLLANGSMSSNSSGEGDIRRALIEADLVETAPRECAPLKSEGIPQVVSAARDNMVALPGQLFTNTQIPACIWFLTKNKAKRTRPVPARVTSSERHLTEIYMSFAPN